MTFDTLKFAERLEAGGFSTTQARAAAGAFEEATREQLATNGDLSAVRADIVALRADLRQTEFRLEAKIEATKAEILKWRFGQTLSIIGVPMALLRFGH